MSLKKDLEMVYHHHIDTAYCKGCGLCVAVCPKSTLEISTEISPNGYFPAIQVRPDDCIYCAICCTICPDVAISITESAEKNLSVEKTEKEHG